MNKITTAFILIVSLFHITKAQSLEKMTWFNEPAQWEIKDKKLIMAVTPQSDYWRISHYGFTLDDAPFYYSTYGGEFETKVKITGDYNARFDQMGLMLRIDEQCHVLKKVYTFYINTKIRLQFKYNSKIYLQSPFFCNNFSIYNLPF